MTLAAVFILSKIWMNLSCLLRGWLMDKSEYVNWAKGREGAYNHVIVVLLQVYFWPMSCKVS